MIKKAMEESGWETCKYLVDGFPRNQDNYDGWQEVMGQVVNVPFAFWFDVNEEELEKRIFERSKTSGRNDDAPDVLKKRIVNFKTEQMPIINMYAEMGKLKKIEGTRPIEEVYEDVKQALAGYI